MLETGYHSLAFMNVDFIKLAGHLRRAVCLIQKMTGRLELEIWQKMLMEGGRKDIYHR